MNNLESWLNTSLHSAFQNCMEGYFKHSPMRPMLEYHFEMGGKKLRPLAVVLAAESVWRIQGNPNPIRDSAIPYALAVELLHNATLIHDDIQDGDELRRGRPAVWKKYSLAQGINCGDALFFAAQRVVQEASYLPQIKADLLTVLARETFAVIEGQSQEFSLKEDLLSSRAIQSADYEKMVRGKTSALFVMPYAGGAILAGANPQQLQELSFFAGELGFAFQIQDDLLDLWGAKGRDQVGTDIAEGKLSYPMVLAFNGMSSKASRLRDILICPREQTTADEIHWAIEELENCGAKEKSIAQAERILARISESKDWKECFAPVVERLQKALSEF